MAAGPTTTSSRWLDSTRKKWQVPEKIPVAMLSCTSPTELIFSPVCWMNHCISEAARHARSACTSPEKRSKSASPRNLSTSPPRRYAMPIRPSKTPLTARTSSSAPARPFA